MSGVVTQKNLLSAIRKLAESMGGLSQVGDFQSIIGKVQNGTATLAELEKAIGPSAALGSSLSEYGSG